MTGAVQLSTAVPDRATADRLAGALVAEGLAACAQVAGPIRSTYRWRGAVEQADEWLVLAKTTALAAERAIPRLRALHPYESPEIIAVPIVLGDHDYLRWIEREVAG